MPRKRILLDDDRPREMILPVVSCYTGGVQPGRSRYRLAAAGFLCLAFAGQGWAADENVVTTPAQPAPPGVSAPSPASQDASLQEIPSRDRSPRAETPSDGRAEAIQSFLEGYSCSISDLAHEFALAAERNDLDYRLLPVLAVIESGCGRMTRNHNLFGWANGRKPFGSFRESIHFVACRLRVAPHYRGKSLHEKLRVYNRRKAYQQRVLTMMRVMPEPASEGLPPDMVALPSGSE